MDLSLSSDAKLLTSMTPADALKNFKRRGFFDKTRKLMAEKFTEEEEEQEIDSEKARLKQDIEKVLRHEWRILHAQSGDRIWNNRASIAKELNSAIERTVLTDLSRPLRAFLVSNTDTIKENVYESLAAILNEERKKREAALLLAEEAIKRTQEKEGNEEESGGKESVGEKEKQQRNEKKLDSHDLNAKSNNSSTKMDVDSVVVPVIQSKETLPSPATVEMTHQPPVVEQPNFRVDDKISEISVVKTTSEAPNTNNDSSLPSLSSSITKLSTSNDGSVTSSDMASSSAQQQLQQQQPLQQQQSKKRESSRASSRLKGVIRNTSPTDESSTNNNDSSNSNQVETTLEIAEPESNSRDAAALTVVEAMDSVTENIATGRGDAEDTKQEKKKENGEKGIEKDGARHEAQGKEEVVLVLGEGNPTGDMDDDTPKGGEKDDEKRTSISNTSTKKEAKEQEEDEEEVDDGEEKDKSDIRGGRRIKRKGGSGSNEPESSNNDSTAARKRGRPRKVVAVVARGESAADDEEKDPVPVAKVMKKGRHPKKIESQRNRNDMEEDEEIAEEEEGTESDNSESVASNEVPVSKKGKTSEPAAKKGRLRKGLETPTVDDVSTNEEAVVKKTRGRPRKNPVAMESERIVSKKRGRWGGSGQKGSEDDTEEEQAKDEGGEDKKQEAKADSKRRGLVPQKKQKVEAEEDGGSESDLTDLEALQPPSSP